MKYRIRWENKHFDDMGTLTEFKINNGYVMPQNIIYYIPGNLLAEIMV